MSQNILSYYLWHESVKFTFVRGDTEKYSVNQSKEFISYIPVPLLFFLHRFLMNLIIILFFEPKVKIHSCLKYFHATYSINFELQNIMIEYISSSDKENVKQHAFICATWSISYDVYIWYRIDNFSHSLSALLCAFLKTFFVAKHFTFLNCNYI